MTIRKLFDGYNRDVWPEMVEWLVDHIDRFVKAMSPKVSEIGKKIKSQVLPEVQVEGVVQEGEEEL